MDKLRLTEHGNNASICVHTLSAKDMRKAGFTDHREGWWYACWIINDSDISMNVSIKKDNNDWCIDILDENFCQPYDYQMMLHNNPDHQYAQMIKAFVDAKMLWLKCKGIISGWSIGDYV